MFIEECWSVYEEELFFKELSERLEEEGLDEVSHILKLLRDGCDVG